MTYDLNRITQELFPSELPIEFRKKWAELFIGFRENDFSVDEAVEKATSKIKDLSTKIVDEYEEPGEQ